MQAKRLERIIQLHEQKKEVMMNQIMLLKKDWQHKSDTVRKFKLYAEEYAKKNNSLSMKSIEMIKNTEAFYQNVCQVITAEEKALMRLDETKNQLVEYLRVWNHKIENLKRLLKDSRLKEAHFLNSAEEIEIDALYINFKGVT